MDDELDEPLWPTFNIVEAMLADFTLEEILERNDVLEEDVLEFLIEHGWIDTEPYE